MNLHFAQHFRTSVKSWIFITLAYKTIRFIWHIWWPAKNYRPQVVLYKMVWKSSDPQLRTVFGITDSERFLWVKEILWIRRNFLNVKWLGLSPELNWYPAWDLAPRGKKIFREAYPWRWQVQFTQSMSLIDWITNFYHENLRNFLITHDYQIFIFESFENFAWYHRNITSRIFLGISKRTNTYFRIRLGKDGKVIKPKDPPPPKRGQPGNLRDFQYPKKKFKFKIEDFYQNYLFWKVKILPTGLL